jgi:hypothetical protein
MPRPADTVINIPPEELRVVLSPSNEMTMWVPIFAEQPGSTICHADGTILCRGGPNYHEELRRAYQAYLDRQARGKTASAAASSAAAPEASAAPSGRASAGRT